MKREYSREFKATGDKEKRKAISIDKIPPGLFIRIRAKAKREGVSLRALILGWLKAWVSQ